MSLKRVQKRDADEGSRLLCRLGGRSNQRRLWHGRLLFFNATGLQWNSTSYGGWLGMYPLSFSRMCEMGWLAC